MGQQISDKARETIWDRICKTYTKITPEHILSISDDDLRNVGLSGAKVEYIKSLAESIVMNKIDLEKFKEFSNEKIVDDLTTIKGIGRWTAEMYLIFSLGRENILSKGDGTIKRAIQWMYNLSVMPTSQELSGYFVNWTEYSTIVSAYLWKSVALGLTKKPFNEIFS